MGQEGSQRGKRRDPRGTQIVPSSAFAQGAPQEHTSRRICTSSSTLRIIPAWLRSCVRSWLTSKLQAVSRVAQQPQPHPCPIPQPTQQLIPNAFIAGGLVTVRGLRLLLPAAATAPGASVQQVHAVGQGCPTSSWVGGSPSWGWRRLRGQQGWHGQGDSRAELQVGRQVLLDHLWGRGECCTLRTSPAFPSFPAAALTMGSSIGLYLFTT